MNKQFLTATVFLFAGLSQAAQIDSAKSSFQWKAEKKVGSGHHGKVPLKTSKLELKGDKIHSGEFVLDLTAITVTDLEGEWATKFLGHVKGSDFFEVEKYPTAKLVLSEQKKDGEVPGVLTIKDKSQPVVVKFAKDGSSYKGTLNFDRTKFGIIYGAGNFFKELAADKVIKDEVAVDFVVALKK